ncbi:ribosome biogenesis GTPase [Duganella sp. CF458]|uniref:ribosome small subunit-dependent GTPase A n=1 Tax=Duganella sp. CF458 TaxID=1884368 RepID=UPI0008F4555F|nr:ribosome small subunit-dependent GTPase A [Duganella sp. CF458]SFF60180.1 ribosome biogenesis GTPase [Duganella sp. CF458]
MIDFDYEALRSIGLNNTIISRLAEAPAGKLYRITEYQRDRITLHDGSTEIHARALPRLLVETPLCVGDWVVAERNSFDEVWISHRLSPMNQFARADAPPIASNIDTALLVMGLDGDFNLRRIERYLALAAAAEVTPLVILSKPDLCVDADGHVAALTKRLPSGTQFLLVNGTDRESIAQLAPWLGAGQTICLLGSSGAGKSTLTNALAGAVQETGGVRRTDHRGRHTTTARSMHLCPSGACIIDTPGLRSLSPESLSSAFDDIESLAAGCQFRDCRHEGEPGCAVVGHVDPDRLHNFHKLQREVRRNQQTALERIAERQKWKVVLRSAAVRSRLKRG